MIRRTLVPLALGATLTTLLLAGPAGATAPHALRGTFKLSAGSCADGGVTGSWFRMVYPGGTVANGKFFANPDSQCTANTTYTLVVPGTQGGLVTGSYQSDPSPAFNSQGGALADNIIEPQSFTGIDFSVATDKVDPQTNEQVPAPSIKQSGANLTGQVTAWSAAWNKLYFNQGSPKPGGSYPGLTQKVSGTYNSKTHAFVLTWASAVVGGPFNGFTGVWHLAGTFVAKR
ncbi:MAG TPA: hypothetical protein VEG62_03025 [Acidimicrobiales bacterium]|nr:hypothetical protein [Acidimicrobiales bacterium]HXZ61689.1 hypothetical protein [Acidimicrobiales bacterium]